MKQGATRFMVMGVPRSGTTWLADLLHSHPDILCMREPFHQDWQGRRQRHQQFWNDEEFFLHKQDRGTGKEGRGSIARGRRYLKRKIWTLPAPVVGFKGLFPNITAHPDLDKYFKEMGDNLHTIWLFRNPVRCYLSFVHAQRFKQWDARHKNHIKERPKINLSADPLAKTIKQIEHSNRNIHKWCSNVLCIEYPELLGNHYETMGQVLQFLHVRPWALHTDCLRLQPGELKKLVNNLPELREQLPVEYRHYLDEDEIL